MSLIGRLSKDVELKYIPSSEMAVATFTLAIDLPVGQGKEKQADFPRITVFDKQAENCEKFIGKGRLVGITGRIQTGKYEGKDGKTVYTTDVVANNVEFLDYADKKEETKPQQEALEGFAAVDDDDIPF